MKSSVLRGFCQKSLGAINMVPMIGKEGWLWIHTSSVQCEHEPCVYALAFLSPQQMLDVLNDEQYRSWADKNFHREAYTRIIALVQFIRDEPFLVAKILHDASHSTEEGVKE